MLNDSLHTLGMNTPGEKNVSVTHRYNKKEWTQYVFTHPITFDSAVAKLREKPNYYNTDFAAQEEIANLKAKGNILDTGGMLEWVN